METKYYYTQDNIGKVKYTISYHNGLTKHKDGSPFYGIYGFSNKRKFHKRLKQLISEGYIQKPFKSK
jgi:hypothetical protein